MTFEQIISLLKKTGNKEKVILKEKKFGIIATHSLGIYHSALKEIAKQIGKDNALAIQLFDSGIYEARILCSKLYQPKDLTDSLMEKWAVTFENWEICDTFCMGLFSKSKLAVPKAMEWANREKEFEKRAGFAIMAAYCMADKKAPNKVLEQFFPIILKHASDNRIYVKKAVNWALRNIGKRNNDLNKKAIKVANQLTTLNSKAAQWVAKDALRELQSQHINILDYPREVYRKKI
jgi:3-methyladenine DNA glycosylase AlkD